MARFPPMLTRSHVAALPADELARLADAALRASAARHGLPPVRAAALPRALQIEAALQGARWAALRAG